MNVMSIFHWLEGLLLGAVEMSNWFLQPIQILHLSMTPLELLTIGGLIAYLGIAIVKWVIS